MKSIIGIIVFVVIVALACIAASAIFEKRMDKDLYDEWRREYEENKKWEE